MKPRIHDFPQEYNLEHPEQLPKRKRAKTIRKMGVQPEIAAGEIQRIDQTQPNPRSAEPFSFPRRPELVQQKETVRRVNEAEIEELLDWGIDKLQRRFPRASRESVLPELRAATRGGKMYFARTNNACGLFVAEVTPWEPALFVDTRFVISRVVAEWEVKKLYQAGRDWAKSIGACGFRYDPLVGSEATAFEPTAKSIGYTHADTKFVARFDVEVAPVQRVLDGNEIAARLAMA